MMYMVHFVCGLVYTSNKREGQPGFSFPKGCPEGKENPGCPDLLLEVCHSFLSCLIRVSSCNAVIYHVIT